MRSIALPRGARLLLLISIVARLPIVMLPLALLVHAEHLTGSFASAGAVVGAYSLGGAIGGPRLGQLVDRRGQTGTLLVSAVVSAALLVVIALLPVGAPLPVLAALAAGTGLVTPPVGPCLRAQLPLLLLDSNGARAAFAFEASVLELTYVVGPALALSTGSLWSTGAAVLATGLILVVATVAFALQPTARGGQAVRIGRLRTSSMHTPAMRILAVLSLAIGVLLGADEVAITAVAKALSGPAAAAPLFIVWGLGSFLGGLVATRLGGGARSGLGLALLLGALGVGHLALIPAQGAFIGMASVLFVAGATISPTEATVNAMVEHATPTRTAAKAFAWLATAVEVGSGIGASTAGVLIDRVGAGAVFALAGGVVAAAAIATLVRSSTLGTNARQTPESSNRRSVDGFDPALPQLPTHRFRTPIHTKNGARYESHRGNQGPDPVCRDLGARS